MQELFDTGKTKNKVVGFVSKAGNQFDTCLKFEDERIQFDFDNPGETSAAEATQNAQPWLAEDATLKEGQEQQVKVREETMKSFEDENVESLQEAPEPAADDYWASLMAGAADENAMNEEMDSMILSEQMLEDDGLPWN